MHNGTHMDTPRHFDPNGPTIEQLPIEDFYYTRPFVLRLDKKKGEMVTMQDVQAHLDELKTCDLLLICWRSAKHSPNGHSGSLRMSISARWPVFRTFRQFVHSLCAG